MKKLLNIFIMALMVLSIGYVNVFAASTSIAMADSANNITTQSKIPSRMKPGTILMYDENLLPIVVKGGYSNTMVAQSRKPLSKPSPVKIPEGATEEEVKQIELENEIALEQYNAYVSGNYIEAPAPKIYPGMKVVYDENTGDINNIYYIDKNDPSGYSLHNIPDSITPALQNVNSPAAANNISWTWGIKFTNILTYQAADDSFLGTGRATYFTGTTGNRDNTLKDYDCATKQAYDYSKKGDKDVSIRNLDTNKVFTFHQASVGSLPDAIIDIWGLKNIRTLADSSTATAANNVRYYHKRFSDQSIPVK